MKDQFVEDLIESRKLINEEFIKADEEREAIIELFQKEYPELSQEFSKITREMYETFARKHMDYGL